MVKTRIRHFYECETCGEQYDRFYQAKECENFHNYKSTKTKPMEASK